MPLWGTPVLRELRPQVVFLDPLYYVGPALRDGIAGVPRRIQKNSQRGSSSQGPNSQDQCISEDFDGVPVPRAQEDCWSRNCGKNGGGSSMRKAFVCTRGHFSAARRIRFCSSPLQSCSSHQCSLSDICSQLFGRIGRPLGDSLTDAMKPGIQPSSHAGCAIQGVSAKGLSYHQ